ncbi:Swt1 family HEPN domain-containing protein [Microbacterium sp. CGR1]|uniref:Swt1 family HEPN domain-containing protein n=1 Tax=Microbacterium sp. CGR1 TaxID=1696072 RepID=UPI003DA43711
MDDRLYNFVYRGMLTEEALDAAGRPGRTVFSATEADIERALSLELFDPDMLDAARLMSVLYAAIAAFEHSVRKFVSRVLIDAFAEDWWDEGVSKKIREFAESRKNDEEKTKWHGVRGENLLSYTELGHLPNIMQQNWELFEPYVRRLDWATSIFGTIERSRNVIMHSGNLEMPDVERIGILMRDWNKQVGL